MSHEREKVCINSASYNKTRKFVFVNMNVLGETFSRGTIKRTVCRFLSRTSGTDSYPRKFHVLKNE